MGLYPPIINKKAQCCVKLGNFFLLSLLPSLPSSLPPSFLTFLSPSFLFSFIFLSFLSFPLSFFSSLLPSFLLSLICSVHSFIYFYSLTIFNGIDWLQEWDFIFRSMNQSKLLMHFLFKRKRIEKNNMIL